MVVVMATFASLFFLLSDQVMSYVVTFLLGIGAGGTPGSAG
jgi:hypothetical protein